MSAEFTIDASEITALANRLDGLPKVLAEKILATMWASVALFEEAVSVNTPVNYGHLRASIAGDVYGKPDSGELVGIVTTPLVYGAPVEFGRNPGRRPPVDAIENWVVRKLGIQDNARDVAFLIARAIGRRGTQGAHMFERGFEQRKGDVLRLWDEIPGAIAEAL